MKKYKIILKYSIFCLCLLEILFTLGCGVHHIFSSDGNVYSTPAQQGLLYEDIWFQARDGTQLHAWLIEGKPGNPLILYFHGNNMNISNYMDKYAYLNSMGFHIFIFDYRGYGASQGKIVEEEDFYQDARGALDYLKGKGWSPSEMVFWGHSIGTGVAIHMATESQPAGIVLEAPFTTFPELAKHKHYILYQLLGRWFMDMKFDNLKKIEEISSPLLIIHGYQDTTIPWEMSYLLFKKANGQKSYNLSVNAGHSNAYEVEPELYRTAIIKFMNGLNI